jgi:ligand-binding SRPBCC domain-containing protein
MQNYTLQREQYVPRELEQIFPFFERPENLALITPPQLEFRLLTPSPVKMEQGRVIDYTIRLFGIPVRWRSLISHYDPPHCFVDEQLQGPYSFWHHTHRFLERGSGTLLCDEVRFAMPLYLPPPIGALMHEAYLGPMLKLIFDYRRDLFENFFGKTNQNLATAKRTATEEA